MRNEINVLRNINNNGYTTQRDIARLTGMSLGNVNAAIRSLTAKGFLEKRIGSSERDSRYLLTEIGTREKSIAVFNIYFGVIRTANNIKNSIKEIINIYYVDRQKKLLIYGEDDEIYRYLINEIIPSINIDYGILDDIAFKASEIEGIIMVWNPDYEQKIKSFNKEYINILTCIDDMSTNKL